MEEQKKTTETNPTNAEVKLVDKEPVAAAVESTPASTAGPRPRSQNRAFTWAAIVLVIIALIAVWFRLEKEGRVDTSFFSGILASQEAAAVVATVNGEELVGADLELSLEQLRQAAIAQGMDPEDASVQTEIRTQAVEMLVNSTLLQQEAAERGIVISDEQITERMAELEEQAGGAEVLAARMEEFDIDEETFAADVRIELTIVTLLDQIFADQDLSVSDEEVATVYERAGGLTPDAPALEEVRPQIEAQIRQAKEQAAVDQYLQELRTAADIEIVS